MSPPPSTVAGVSQPIDEDDPLPPEDRAPRHDAADYLYRSQSSRLMAFFARRGARSDASDLVQDSFLRLARAEQRRRVLAEPAAYLTQIAKNLLRNRARSAYYRSIAAGEGGGPHASADLVHEVEARDALRHLERALLKLKPKTREIFLAHRLDGATYAEIAQLHGLTVKGVEWHMSKAIAHIHRSIDRP